MRIVFDVSPLALPPTGIGKYHLGSLRGLAEAAAGRHEIVAFALTGPRGRRAIPPLLDGLAVRRRILFVPPARAWRRVWSRLGRPPVERVAGPLDVFHFSDWMYPSQRGGVRSTMIHDLIPLRFPEWVHPTTRALHGPKYRNAARTCDVVFVNSEFTKREVVELLAVPPERVRVAPPGVDARYRPDGARPERTRPYVLALDADEPRKNIGTLEAAARLLDGELDLVLAGGRRGYVSDDELARLYRGAAAFAYPSRFEGFGMPVVEALASGTAVVASSHESLDEACGDAALRVEPDDVEGWAAALREAAAARDELARRGREHARSFTWERTGRIFLDAFEELTA